MHPRAAAILSFWFGEGFSTAPPTWFPAAQTKQWFGSHVDQHIADNFKADQEAVAAGLHNDWQDDPWNALAGVVALDQFSRNLHRNSPRAWENDPQALTWARHMLEHKMEERLPLAVRVFIALPFEHSETLADQEECVRLVAKWLDEAKALQGADPELVKFLDSVVKYAEAHRDIIAKWGRFPHRNAVLGRASTEAEVQGLADGSIRSF